MATRGVNHGEGDHDDRPYTTPHSEDHIAFNRVVSGTLGNYIYQQFDTRQ